MGELGPRPCSSSRPSPRVWNLLPTRPLSREGALSRGASTVRGAGCVAPWRPPGLQVFSLPGCSVSPAQHDPGLQAGMTCAAIIGSSAPLPAWAGWAAPAAKGRWQAGKEPALRASLEPADVRRGEARPGVGRGSADSPPAAAGRGGLRSEGSVPPTGDVCRPRPARAATLEVHSCSPLPPHLLLGEMEASLRSLGRLRASGKLRPRH